MKKWTVPFTVLLLLGFLTLPSFAFDVQVTSSISGPLSGIKVYAFTEAGSYTGFNATTDGNGIAFFEPGDFPDGNYTFRVDYLGGQFWSEAAAIPQDPSISVVIDEETVTVTVADGSTPMEGIRVYLFSGAGAYLGSYAVTDLTGQISFDLPLGMDVKFRGDYLGYQFWSEQVQVSTNLQVNLQILHQPIEITVEGLFQGATEALSGIRVYLFSAAGAYQGQYRETDPNGHAGFSLPERAYKVRADYMARQFWSGDFTWQDMTVSVPLADADVAVTGSGLPLEGIRVYLFSETGTYLGLYETTGSNGQVSFRVPAGTYKFRADYQGNQYWSSDAVLFADQLNPVSISTGGGAFTFTVLRGASDPLAGVPCYVFNEAGAYLGLNGVSDENGQVEFNLSEGRYRIRTDYLGYPFWSEIFQVPDNLDGTLVISHADVKTTVESGYQNTTSPLEDIPIYLFTPSGTYLGWNHTTDENGEAIFHLPEQAYKVRADVLSQPFWSGEFTWQDQTVTVPMAVAEVTVTSSNGTLEGVQVYVFSGQGTYLDISGTTDSNGKTQFQLPAGDYQFRGDYLGGRFWSGEVMLTAHQLNPVEISTGGGTFTFTVLKGETDPLIGVKCYVFSEGGTYLGISGTTDENGQVVFDLATGGYKFRVDYLGYQYWSDVYAVPTTLNDVFTIPHQELTITVEGVYGTSSPIEGVHVYLFSPSGAYLGQAQVTDVNGQILLNLPDQAYKVRVDYLGQQFWSDEFQSTDTTVTVNQGLAQIHVHRAGTDIEGARVYLFSEAGSYLGRYGTTDESGHTAFILPDRSFKFRVDEGGNQYWSPVVVITAGVVNDIEIDLTPATVSISADPEIIQVGATATLTWQSTNAYACEIEPGIGTVSLNGSLEVSPGETTEYVISATGPAGVVTDNVQVSVTAEITVPDDVDYGLAVAEQEGGAGLVGETIRVLNGNAVEYRSDLSFSSPNSLGFSFDAAYNSRSATSGTLGFGWTHRYALTLDSDFEWGGTSYIRVSDSTGSAHYFKEEGSGTYQGVFHERSAVKLESGEYVWYRLDGGRCGFSATGQLTWIEDEKGNRMTLTYDGDVLTAVTDQATGRALSFTYSEGLLTQVTGPTTAAVPDGIWVTYGYDANRNLTSVTYADTSGFAYAYTDPNDLHNLTEKRDKTADQVILNTWTYDANDRSTNAYSAEQGGLTITYPSDTERQVTDAYGEIRNYSLTDINGISRLSARSGKASPTYGGSGAVRWVYDDALNLVEIEYPNGTVNQYQDYDGRGNPGTVKLAAGTLEERTVTYTYHPNMSRPLARTEVSVLQGAGHKITTWDYDAVESPTPNQDPTMLLYRVIEEGFTRDTNGTDVPYKYVTRFTYNAKGQVLSADGPGAGTGDTTFLAYDPATGDLGSIQRPLVGSTLFTQYDNAGQGGRVTDMNNRTRELTYDGRGRITKIKHLSDNSETALTFDKGKLAIRTDPDNVTQYFYYDSANGKLSRIVDPQGNYIAYQYDGRGNRIEMGKYDSNDTSHFKKNWDYNHPDIPGKLWKEIQGTNETVYGYNGAGELASVTDPETHVTQYQYDPLQRLKTVIQPGSVTTGYAYDAHGNLINVTDANSNTTTYVYDDMGRVVETTSPDTGTVRYAYDEAGNLLKKKDARGIEVTYDYDDLNRLLLVDFPTDTDITYAYDQGTDGKGRLTAMTDAAGSISFGYDAHGRLTTKTNVIDTLSFTVGTSYTPGGRVNTVTYPGGRTLDYTRDYMARMEGLSTTFGGVTQPLVSGMTYNAFGGPKGLSMSSGGEVNNQPGSSCGCIEVANPGTMMERTYTYDGNKNLTGITAPNTPWYNQTFGYDALNRLETASGSYGEISYTYDGTGNRLTRDVNGVIEIYDYDITGKNRLDQITFSDASPQIVFGYDANGNTTTYGGRTLIYNENNRLVEVKEGENTIATYTYNGLGQRLKKTVGGITTYYVYDQNGQLIAETTSGAATEYLYMGKIRMAMVDAATGDFYFYLNDRLGTPQLMTYGDSTTVMWEARYKPFGDAMVHPQSGVVNNFRFPGQYFDEETGFHYNYHRYYDPGTGRYLRADPIGLLGGINLFAYADNSPVNSFDILGLARYRVYWSIESVSYLGMTAAKLKGLVIAMEKNVEGLYDAIEFEGLLGGVSVGLPLGITVKNTEIFEDPCERPDVARIQGLSWILSGTAAFNKEGVSGGAYYFGGLRGTSEDISQTEGYDLAVDYLGGYIWTKGSVQNMRHHELY